MTKKEAQKKIERLTELVAYHNQLYHQYNRPEISDYEFDQLLGELIQLEAKYPAFRLSQSPTQVLGEIPSKNFATVYHQYPMLSLSNTYSALEVSQFIQRIQKQLPGEFIEFFCELKFDGVAVSLLYHEGVLSKVVTRGDGMKGDDITQNAKQIASIPQVVQAANFPSEFEARGEVFMPIAQFKELNQLRLAHHEEPLANPRNATAGTLKTIKSSSGPKRLLDCYMYAFRSAVLNLPTHEAGIQILAQWGFPISPTYKKCSSLKEILEYIDYWEHAKKGLDMAIDGVVIKVNDLDQQKRLGLTAKSPRWAIAFKYKPESVSTILEKVSYQVGRTGVITPVAHLKPTFLAGTTVKKASLHNAQEIYRLGLHLGDTVLIEKGGDIIPKVTGVDLNKRNPNSEPIVFISHCPACGSALVNRHKQSLCYCPNNKICPQQVQARLVHFVQRRAMDIQAIGKQTITLLIEKGLVHDPADLYELSYGHIHGLEGFKDLSTQNLLRGIQQSKGQSFPRLLFALGIPHIGEVVANKLVTYYPTIEALLQAKSDDLQAIPDIGPEIATSLITYFQNPENLVLIKRLQKAGLQLSYHAPATAAAEEQTLIGKNFIISGVFQNLDREQLKDLIKSRGGKVLTGLSNQIDYLVTGSHAGPAKLAKATDLAIPIINEETILKMLKL